MENFGLTPVYPMREDLHVGDVLLYVPTGCGETISQRPETALLGTVGAGGIRDRFSRFYDDRPTLPRTSSNAPSGLAAPNAVAKPTENAAQTFGVFQQPEATDADPIFMPGGRTRGYKRPRLAAFPGFTLQSFSRAELGLGAPGGGGLGRFLGLSGNDSSRVSVGVSQVEEVQLPAPELIDAIYTFLASDEARTMLDPGDIVELVSHMGKRHSPGENECADKPAPPALVFVNRVFYARAIEFDTGDDSNVAAAIGAAIDKAEAFSQRPSFPQPTAPAPGAPPPAPATSGAIDSLLSPLVTLAGSQAPGFGATFGYGQSGNVILRQAFDRPLAFGVDLAFSYELASILELLKAETLRREQAAGRASTPTGSPSVAERGEGMVQVASAEDEAGAPLWPAQAQVEPSPPSSRYDEALEYLQKEFSAQSARGPRPVGPRPLPTPPPRVLAPRPPGTEDVARPMTERATPLPIPPGQGPISPR